MLKEKMRLASNQTPPYFFYEDTPKIFERQWECFEQSRANVCLHPQSKFHSHTCGCGRVGSSLMSDNDKICVLSDESACDADQSWKHKGINRCHTDSLCAGIIMSSITNSERRSEWISETENWSQDLMGINPPVLFNFFLRLYWFHQSSALPL